MWRAHCCQRPPYILFGDGVGALHPQNHFPHTEQIKFTFSTQGGMGLVCATGNGRPPFTPNIFGVSIVAILAARSFCWIERGPASDGPAVRFGRAFTGQVVTLHRPYYSLPTILSIVLLKAQYLPRMVSFQVCCTCIMHPGMF